jgi:hypothetical protein
MNLAAAAVAVAGIVNPIPNSTQKDVSEAFFLHAVVGKGAKNNM